MVLLDPAPTEETQRRKEPGARNGIVVEGIDAWGRRYILDIWADRVDPLDVIHKVLELCDKWGTDSVGIEEVVFSIVYRHWLQREAESRNKYIRCVRLEPGKRDKDTRITSQIPACREGVYYLNRVGSEKFLQEYMEYPYGETRDLLDAWAYDYRLSRPESAAEAYERVVGVGNDTKDVVTGY
jgi:phage terminase large subunit-like protein